MSHRRIHHHKSRAIANNLSLKIKGLELHTDDLRQPALGSTSQEPERAIKILISTLEGKNQSHSQIAAGDQYGPGREKSSRNRNQSIQHTCSLAVQVWMQKVNSR